MFSFSGCWASWCTVDRPQTLIARCSEVDQCVKQHPGSSHHGINIRQDPPSHFLFVVQFHEGRKIVFRHQTENVLPRPVSFLWPCFLYIPPPATGGDNVSLTWGGPWMHHSGAGATLHSQSRFGSDVLDACFKSRGGDLRWWRSLLRFFWSPGLRRLYGRTECEENLRQIVLANSGRKCFDCTVTLCAVKGAFK